MYPDDSYMFAANTLSCEGKLYQANGKVSQDLFVRFLIAGHEKCRVPPSDLEIFSWSLHFFFYSSHRCKD